jgi:hypothetical protein
VTYAGEWRAGDASVTSAQIMNIVFALASCSRWP